MRDNGFVFGKFYPPHLGHKSLVEFAASQCTNLTVLVCASHTELLSGSARLKWLQAEFRRASNISFKLFSYDEAELPNTSESDYGVSQLWSDVFKMLLPEVDLVVTSEPYGAYVASFMGIEHISFDPNRRARPISSTAIRNDLLTNWDSLLDAAKRDLQKVVVVCGTESTGKSTFVKMVSESLACSHVEEVGRALVPSSDSYTMDDLRRVAIQHAENIMLARQKLQPLVVVDTDVYITQSYAQFSFGAFLELSDEVYEANGADLRLYMDASASYVQDGTRLTRNDRDLLDCSHRMTLSHFGQSYCEIQGSDWGERDSQALKAIHSVLQPPWGGV